MSLLPFILNETTRSDLQKEKKECFRQSIIQATEAPFPKMLQVAGGGSEVEDPQPPSDQRVEDIPNFNLALGVRWVISMQK